MACPAGFEPSSDEDEYFIHAAGDAQTEDQFLQENPLLNEKTAQEVRRCQKKPRPPNLRRKIDALQHSIKSTEDAHTKVLRSDDLVQAVRRGNAKSLRECLSSGYDANAPVSTGWSPLMYAAQSGKSECLQVLIEYGADVNFHKDDYSVLMAACSSSSKEEELLRCVDMLLSANSSINARSQQLMTPIIYAAKRGHAKLVKKLLENGADPNLGDNRGYTAIMRAVDEGNVEVIKELVEASVDLSKQTESGATVVDLAIECGNKEIMKLLQCEPDRSESSDSQSTNEVKLSEQPVAAQATMEQVSSHDKQVVNGNLHNDVKHDERSPFSFETISTEVKGTVHKPDEAASATKPRSVSEEYEGLADALSVDTYGDLEIFLSGLDLSQFIPLFKENLVSFETLLRMTDEDLKDLGVVQFAPRRRILEAVLYVHKKDWKVSSLPKINRRKPLKCSEAIDIVLHVKKHLLVLASSAAFVRDQVSLDKEVLRFSQCDEAVKLFEIAQDATSCTKDLFTELSELETSISQAFDNPTSSLPAHVILESKEQKTPCKTFGLRKTVVVTTIVGLVLITCKYWFR